MKHDKYWIRNLRGVLGIACLFLLGACHPEFKEICFDPFYLGKYKMTEEGMQKIPYDGTIERFEFDTYFVLGSFFSTTRLQEKEISSYRNRYCHLDTSMLVYSYYTQERHEVFFRLGDIINVTIYYTSEPCYTNFTDIQSTGFTDIMNIAVREYHDGVAGFNVALSNESNCPEIPELSTYYVGDVLLGDLAYEDVYVFETPNDTYTVYYTAEDGLIGLENGDRSVYFYLKNKIEL